MLYGYYVYINIRHYFSQSRLRSSMAAFKSPENLFQGDTLSQIQVVWQSQNECYVTHTGV